MHKYFTTYLKLIFLDAPSAFEKEEPDILIRLDLSFFLEYAGELHIFVLRETKGPIAQVRLGLISQLT